jgi:cell division protease FtsH
MLDYTLKDEVRMAKHTPTKNSSINNSNSNGSKSDNGPTNTANNKQDSTLPNSKDVKKFELKLNLNQFFNRGLLFVFVAVLFLPFLFSMTGLNKENNISLSQLINDIRADKVQRLEVAGANVKIKYKDGADKVARKEDNQQVLDVLNKSGIDLTKTDVEVKNLTLMDMAGQVLINFLPIIPMAIILFILFRQARGAQDIMGIGRSKAKLFVKGKQDIKFSDVGGMDEAKRELEEIVDFMKHPKKYKKVGARTPKGVLLVGPSGTGKTLLARAVAG